MKLAAPTYQPVQYSERVLGLQREIKQLEQKLADLPQESVQLSQQVAKEEKLEKQSHLLALGSAGLSVAGFAVSSVFGGAAGYGVAALGLASALGFEVKAANHHSQAEDRQHEHSMLGLKSYHIQEKIGFLSEWECSRRHTEWHEVNGY